jgi:hypothetical protein
VQHHGDDCTPFGPGCGAIPIELSQPRAHPALRRSERATARWAHANPRLASRSVRADRRHEIAMKTSQPIGTLIEFFKRGIDSLTTRSGFHQVSRSARV